MESDLNFAIIDVETTGGHAAKHRVIEVGITIVEKGQIIETYETYINPGVAIPSHITALTGIQNKDVVNAPKFEDVADEIFERLENRIFVAQNVNFDYSFIKKEYALLDRTFKSKRLCTSRYSRKIINGLRSSSLRSLSNYFEVVNENPHRALSDAITAAKILLKLLALDEGLEVAKQLMNPLKSKVTLPVNVLQSDFDKLPGQPGVYFFYDESHKPIYIGKAINLKKRVSSHFNGDLSKKRTQAFLREIHTIEFELTGSDLLAYLFEDMMIKKHWPKYNAAQKGQVKKFGVIAYQDQKGNWRLAVNQVRQNHTALKIFHYYSSAMQWLHETTVKYNLDPKYSGLLSLIDETNEISNEDHNANFDNFLKSDSFNSNKNFILEKGREKGEFSMILINGTRPLSFGFYNRDKVGLGFRPQMEEMKLLGSSATSEKIIENYLKKKNPQLLSCS